MLFKSPQTSPPPQADGRRSVSPNPAEHPDNDYPAATYPHSPTQVVAYATV
jgi:hypothetical protein